MLDQASVLRGLVEQREEFQLAFTSAHNAAPAPAPAPARTVVVTSGKGGVGKSLLSLNLGVALAQAGHTVCLLDANLGLGNIELLCGLNGYWNLAHVVSGARSLREIRLEGPAGLNIIPGASGLVDVADCSPQAQLEILLQLQQLEEEHEFLLIDTGSGIHKSVRRFVAAADLALLMTTPEPTSIADAYATIKAFAGAQPTTAFEILVNRADDGTARDVFERLERTTRMFLQRDVAFAGAIPDDPVVPTSVRTRTPYLLEAPRSPSARATEKLSRRLRNVLGGPTAGRVETFFARLWPYLVGG